ncbi:MAG: ABC transporter permease [Anaerolineae bacterium]
MSGHSKQSVLSRVRGILWPWHIILNQARAQPLLTSLMVLAWLVFVALLSAIPMYSDAANQFVLNRELSGGAVIAPPFAFYFHQVGAASAAVEPSTYAAVDGYLQGEEVVRYLGMPRQTSMHFVTSDTFRLYLSAGDARATEMLLVKLGSIDGLADALTLDEGRMPEPVGPGQPFEVLVSAALAGEAGLGVGDALTLFRSDREVAFSPISEPLATPIAGRNGQGETTATSETVSGVEQRVELAAVVAGVWTVSDEVAARWYPQPAAFDHTLWVPKDQYLALAERNAAPRLLYSLGYYDVYDGASVRADQVPALLRRIRSLKMRLQLLIPGLTLELSPIAALLRYQRSSSGQTWQILGFLVPFVGLILYFMVGISSLTIDQQKLQIAIMRSRGASSRQVFLLYLVQALIMGIVALAVGPLLGRLLAQSIGVRYQFLATGEQLSVVITRTSRLYALGGVAVALLATVLPAVAASRFVIVDARNERARPRHRPLWQRAGLDGLLLAASLYGYYLLKSQGRLAAWVAGRAASPLANPLLFLAPTLFLTAMALIIVRIFPLVPAVCAVLGEMTRGAAVPLAFRNLQRDGTNYRSVLLLLVLGTGLALFTASAAETLDHNATARIRYAVGADLALHEGAGIVSSGADTGGDGGASGPTAWKMLPIEHHLRARGANAVTPVLKLPARVDLAGDLIAGTFVGIDRATFPQVAAFPPACAPVSLGALMNALAREPSGIIVSRAVLQRTGLTMGETLSLAGLVPLTNQTVRFQIVGLVDCFPTVDPAEGEVFVGNMAYLSQEIDGQRPYDVWLSQEAGSDTQTLLDDLYAEGLRVISYQDAGALIQAEQLEPQRTAVFGFLSIGFLITVGLCALAQVLYAMATLRRRAIQSGVLRALGMARHTLAVSISIELGLVVAVGLGAGALLGLVTSSLFLPFLELGSATDSVPPFEVFVAWGQALPAIALLALTSLLVNVVVVIRTVRSSLAEALKLADSAV